MAFGLVPGTKKIKYAEGNWGTMDVRLTDDEQAEIRKFVKNAILGFRSTPAGIAFAFADINEHAYADGSGRVSALTSVTANFLSSRFEESQHCCERIMLRKLHMK
jgi:hypothetical protein